MSVAGCACRASCALRLCKACSEVCTKPCCAALLQHGRGRGLLTLQETRGCSFLTFAIIALCFALHAQHTNWKPRTMMSRRPHAVPLVSHS